MAKSFSTFNPTAGNNSRHNDSPLFLENFRPIMLCPRTMAARLLVLISTPATDNAVQNLRTTQKRYQQF